MLELFLGNTAGMAAAAGQQGIGSRGEHRGLAQGRELQVTTVTPRAGQAELSNNQSTHILWKAVP